MSVKTEVTLDVETMSEFMLYHIYSSGAGMMVLALGALNAGLTAAFFTRGEPLLGAVFLVFALLLFLGVPYSVRRRVKAKKDSRRLTEPVGYLFTQDGVDIAAAEQEGSVPWNKLVKAVERKRILVLYDQKKHAIILPIAQLGEQYGAVKEIIREHMPAAAVRFRKRDVK